MWAGLAERVEELRVEKADFRPKGWNSSWWARPAERVEELRVEKADLRSKGWKS